MSSAPRVAALPRVLHFITHLGLGGAERVAMTIARELRTTHDFAFYAVRGEESGSVGRAMCAELEKLAIPRYGGTRVPMKAGGMLQAGIGAMRAVAQFKPSIIHLHTEIPEAAYATMVALSPRFNSIPLCRTIHNSIYWHHWPRLGRWCERRMVLSQVAAVSYDALRAFAEHRAASGAGELTRAPGVIYNGVAEPAPSGRDRQAPRKVLRLLFAGRFDEQKGVDLLPQILPMIRLEAGCRGELVMYGTGQNEGSLRAWAAGPPAGWTIRMSEPVANLPVCFPDHDLLIMPSRYEGLGLVAIEAMLAGMPIVATDALGLREALPPDYPWIAPAGSASGFGQALQRAIDEHGRWLQVTARAKVFCGERFNLAQMGAAYRHLYEQALGAAKTPWP